MARLMTDDPASTEQPPPRGGELVRRHSLVTRLWHWTNAVTLAVMLMSGLMIFNAHPRLYWGHYGANADPAWLELGSDAELAFPGWITIPSTYSLADARLWHMAFAWLLVLALAGYLLWALMSGHLKRQIAPRLAELSPARLWHEIKQHAQLRFPTGAAALSYNVLQRIAYAGVLFVLLPVVILTGMTMSPGLNSAFPWLDVMFAGRQSARSIHFICAAGLVAFFAVHIIMVVLAGPFNEVRAMISGWYRLPSEREDAE